MKRCDALPYVSFYLDDALSERSAADMPKDSSMVRLVGWQCGFEPLFVAVWSYLNVRLDDGEAADIARDYLLERRWFADATADNEPDYIL